MVMLITCTDYEISRLIKQDLGNLGEFTNNSFTILYSITSQHITTSKLRKARKVEYSSRKKKRRREKKKLRGLPASQSIRIPAGLGVKHCNAVFWLQEFLNCSGFIHVALFLEQKQEKVIGMNENQNLDFKAMIF